MMNDEIENFERRLQAQPLEKIPGEWRAEILAAAISRETKVERRTRKNFWLSTLNFQRSTFFWPNQKAWAALAAIWIFIFALNFSIRDRSPVVAEKFAAPSPEVLVELKKQQLMFAELMGARDLPDADRPKIFSPKPRSEREEIFVT
jgi:hypothetical protein